MLRGRECCTQQQAAVENSRKQLTTEADRDLPSSARHTASRSVYVGVTSGDVDVHVRP